MTAPRPRDTRSPTRDRRDLINALQRETPDFIRGRVFSADYGFVTLTMALSSLGAGIASDRFGPFAATVGTAAMALTFGIAWAIATWRLWRRAPLPS